MIGVAYCDGKRFWEKAGASPLQCVEFYISERRGGKTEELLC